MSWGAQSRSKDAKTPSVAGGRSENPKPALCGIQQNCAFAANRHSRCFTELARMSILAIGYSMPRIGKRPIAELGS
jgi:hypothetical protein